MGLQHLLHHLSFPEGAGSLQSNPVHGRLKGGLTTLAKILSEREERWVDGWVGRVWGVGGRVWGVGCGVFPSTLCPLPSPPSKRRKKHLPIRRQQWLTKEYCQDRGQGQEGAEGDGLAAVDQVEGDRPTSHQGSQDAGDESGQE